MEEHEEYQTKALVVPTKQVRDLGMLDAAQLMPACRENRRDMNRCIDEAKALITRNERSAKACFYSEIPKGDKKVSGPSIGLAEAIAATWGNMIVRLGDPVVEEKSVTIRGYIMDLQSGLALEDTVSRPIMYSKKGDRAGGRYGDDQIEVVKLAARSFLYRNLVLRVVPRPIVAELLDAAREVAAGKGYTWPQRQGLCVKYWQETHGVSKESLLAHLGHAKIEQITVDDVDYLLGIANTIKDSGRSAEEIFSAATEQPPVAENEPENLAAAMAELNALTTEYQVPSRWIVDAAKMFKRPLSKLTASEIQTLCSKIPREFVKTASALETAQEAPLDATREVPAPDSNLPWEDPRDNVEGKQGEGIPMPPQKGPDPGAKEDDAEFADAILALGKRGENILKLCDNKPGVQFSEMRQMIETMGGVNLTTLSKVYNAIAGRK